MPGKGAVKQTAYVPGEGGTAACAGYRKSFLSYCWLIWACRRAILFMDTTRQIGFAEESNIVFFWIFMLLADSLIPLAMIWLGWLFMTKAPKNINAMFGYRTTMSMKNKDTWEFAHKFCGRLWFWCGLALLPVAVIPLVFVLGRSIAEIGTVGGIVCAIEFVSLIGSIFPTEAALKKTFDRNGFHR